MVEALKTGRQIVGVEPGREALGIFGMTPIMRDGKNLANVDVGAAFGKEFVDRAKKRFGIDLAVHSFDGKSFNKLSSTFGENVVAKPDELKSVIDGAPLLRDADLDGHPAAVYVGQIKNYAGQPVARARDHQGHDRIRGRSRQLAAQPDPRHGRDPGCRDRCWRSCSGAACRGR